MTRSLFRASSLVCLNVDLGIGDDLIKNKQKPSLGVSCNFHHKLWLSVAIFVSQVLF